MIQKVAKEMNKRIPIMIDLPGPRITKKEGHGRDMEAISAITKKDEEFIKFGVKHNIEYIAVSYVGSAKDIDKCRQVIKDAGGNQKIIAKIERQEAIDNLKRIISKADAVMVARGDLGDEIPMEKVPFAQYKIIKECKKAGKPVIVATEMLTSMISNPRPTRAEVTDIANAVLTGADAVMLSNETTVGKYPIQAIMFMEKIAVEAEKNLRGKIIFNNL
ncbi:MAG: hypothetical protein K9L98_01705 [Candidatus Pacebacteria bacterium]|nr:hypothetical protein [Candidatus Paceibacterota bacterium]MCF7862703.1 hypothetical protein [Candidatus Paceibacterota bacterium]